MNDNSSIKFCDYLNNLKIIADDYLSNHLGKNVANSIAVDSEEFAEKLSESMRYSCLIGGKRIRPALCLMMGDALGEISNNHIKAGCAVELIHTYSLIHDDLPAMDNDDYRRGKLTNHKVYGEATAILAGDALFTTAFEWLSTLNLEYESALKNLPMIIQIMAECAGSRGMVGGQILDLSAEHKKVNLDYLIKMHEGKTSALLTAPLLIGLALSSFSLVGFNILKEYGKKIGLLFQIVDDILDVEGDASKLGKTTGRDAELEKATYPSILGLEESKKYARIIHGEATKLLDNFVRERKTFVSEQKCELCRLYEFTDYLLNRQF